MSVEEKHKEKTMFRIKKKADPIKRAAKYRSLIIGSFLILVGGGSLVMMLDYHPDFKSFSDLSSFREFLDLWPFWITLLGFVFIIYDYLRNSSRQKYK